MTTVARDMQPGEPPLGVMVEHGLIPDEPTVEAEEAPAEVEVTAEEPKADSPEGA